jgi:hypothetical protein
MFRNMSSEPRRPPGDDGPAPGKAHDLTDAKGMRALAHPLRVRMLELFGYHETLTATQASELLGESPANCAFHLRTLAKYGFVQEAEGGRGRERPWTLANRSMRINSRQEDPQVNLAADELGRVLLERWWDRARPTFGQQNRVPGWDEASGWSLTHLFMTPEETEQMRLEIGGLLDRYEERTTSPALRPPGARPVEWTVFAAPVAAWMPDDPGAGPAPARGGEPGPGAAPDPGEDQVK